MSIYTKGQPRAAVQFKPPDDSKVYLHTSENTDAFGRVVGYENFLGEMMKFFPNFVQEGYQAGAEKTLSDDGIGEWVNGFEKAPATPADPYTRGVLAAGRLDGDYRYRYGDSHNVSIDGKYWGYGTGKGAKNFVFDPSASDFNHFTDLAPSSYDAPVDVSAYSKLLYSSDSAYWKSPDGGLGTIDYGLWANVQNYLKGYGNKSYYEIALTGAKYSDISGDGNTIGSSLETGRSYHVVHHGGFLYDGMAGVNGEGAFYLMTGMLESRRRINYAMSSVFGSPYMINDNKAMLDFIKSTFNDSNKLGGVHDQNKRLLETFFEAQHALRAILPAYSGGVTIDGDGNPIGLGLRGEESINEFNQKDNGYTGYIYSATDQAAFQRFRHWMSGNLKTYTDSLSDDAKENVQKLIREFDFMYDQPYGADQIGVQWKGTGSLEFRDMYVGWDRFNSGWWGDREEDGTWYHYTADGHKFDASWKTDLGYSPENFPLGLSPVAIDPGTGHPNYAIAQILGLTGRQATGYTPVTKNGLTVGDLYDNNWVVQVVGNFIYGRQRITREINNAISLTNAERHRYRKDMQKYREWKVEKKDQEYEDKREDAIAEKKRQERHAMLNKSSKGGLNANSKNSQKSKTSSAKTHTSAKSNSQDFKKAMQKNNLAIMKKIVGANKQRIKNSKEASKG